MWEIVGISMLRGMEVLAADLTEEQAIEKMKSFKKKSYQDGYWDVGWYETIMRVTQEVK